MTNLEFKRKTPPGRYLWAVNDRNHAARRARLEMSHPGLLTLDVDFGLHVVQQALELRASERRTLTAMALPLLFHRVVELLDAIDVLLSAGSALPARSVARTMLETALYVRYLAMKDDDAIAAAYLLASHHEWADRKVEWYDRDPGPNRVDEPRLQEAVFFESLGKERIWRKASFELHRIHRDGAPWFRAFDGPPTVREMIVHLQDEVPSNLALIMDEFGQTGRSIDWVESVNLDKPADPNAVSVLLRPLRATRFYSRTVPTVCHNAFFNALRALVGYFGTEMDGFMEWSDAATRLLNDSAE